MTTNNGALEDHSVENAEFQDSDLADSPENLPKKAWVTLVLFAAFVIGTSGCMINLFLR